jgi:hypothetical protein
MRDVHGGQEVIAWQDNTLRWYMQSGQNEHIAWAKCDCKRACDMWSVSCRVHTWWLRGQEGHM